MALTPRSIARISSDLNGSLGSTIAAMTCARMPSRPLGEDTAALLRPIFWFTATNGRIAASYRANATTWSPPAAASSPAST